MAERRMFSKTIIDSDQFLDMPLSSQCLYFHLSMRADDDGFINNPKRIQRMIGSSDDDIKLLIAKQFIIPFESGIVVIKHWKIHNYIQKDRYKGTIHKEEKSQLIECDKTYEKQCIQDVYTLDTQVRLGKDSIEIELDKDSKDKKKKESKKETYNDILSCFNDELKETYLEFISMRKFIKKPLTNRALKMLITKVNKLSNDEETQIAILNQSILNSWQDVYPLKNNNQYQVIKQEERAF